jgi:hypothetical protein
LMVGSITARTLDYFGWLVAASVGVYTKARPRVDQRDPNRYTAGPQKAN